MFTSKSSYSNYANQLAKNIVFIVTRNTSVFFFYEILSLVPLLAAKNWWRFSETSVKIWRIYREPYLILTPSPSALTTCQKEDDAQINHAAPPKVWWLLWTCNAVIILVFHLFPCVCNLHPCSIQYTSKAFLSLMV